MVSSVRKEAFREYDDSWPSRSRLCQIVSVRWFKFGESAQRPSEAS